LNDQDRFDTKVANWIKQWDGLEKIEIGLIGLPLSKSAISYSGAFMAPKKVREFFYGYQTYVEDEQINLNKLSITDVGDILMHPTDITGSQRRIEDSLKKLYRQQKGMIPFLIGGDHSVTAPSVKAFKEMIGGEIGVIQFDAHHDLRNLEDGGPTNGTPFRSLIESKTINPQKLVQIGIRNYVNAGNYREEADKLGIKVYTMGDVRKRTIEEILEESLEIASRDTKAIYVSVDIDVLDQSFAPGAAAIAPGGMDVWTLMDALEILGGSKNILACDIVCIDPMQDIRDMTSRIGAQLILQLIRGRFKATLK